MDDVAARLRDEFDQAIGESAARFAELAEACDSAETTAAEQSAALIKLWQRRVATMRNRSVAEDAGRSMGA